MMFVYHPLLGENLRLWIDRKNKKLWISCKKTSYSKVMAKWKMLFDEGIEEQEDRETESLNDEDFRKRIDEDLAKKIYGKMQMQVKESNPNGAVR